MDRSKADPTGVRHTSAVGICAGRAEATRAVADLRAAGFQDDQIGVVGRDGTDATAAGERSGLPNDPTYTQWEQGSGVGAAVGTLVGALVGLGVPEDDAARYQGEVEAGRVLVTVQHADARVAEALRILKRHGISENPGSPVGVYGTGVAGTPY